ncbi:MAG: hypothetical protein J2P56_04110 [Verrucomicrobia bacterium]|nr:hypothetical protein [Verrucomicrobiota bacterium]
MPNPTWSNLDNDQKRASLQRVIEKAYWNREFHNACLNPSTMRTTVETEAGVTFDTDVEVRCFQDRAAAEKWVMILLPPLVEQQTPTPPPLDEGFWMCTYPTYNPTREKWR